MILYYALLLLTVFYEHPRLPHVFGLTLVKTVGLIALALAGIRILGLDQPLRLFRWPESRLFFLLCAAVLASQVFVYIEHGLIISLIWSYLAAAGLLVATLAFLDSFERVRTSCYVLIFSLTLHSVSSLSQFYRYDMSRPYGLTGDSNYAALVVLCILPMCFLLFSVSTTGKKVLLGVTGALVVFALLLGASRGGHIGLVICLLYMSFYMHKKVVAIAVLVAILAAGLALAPRTGFTRLARLDLERGVSARSRIELLKSGLNMIRAHPLTGIGIGMFKPSSQKYNANVQAPQIAHNTYVGIAAEMGIPALVLYLFILFLSWRRARRLASLFLQRGEPVNERIVRSLEVGIVGFAVAAVFLTADYVRHCWLLVFLILAIERIITNQEDQIAQPATIVPQHQTRQIEWKRPPASLPGYALRKQPLKSRQGIRSALLSLQDLAKPKRKSPILPRR